MFFAAGVSVGLLGIVSKVRLRVRRTFNLFGQQVTGATSAVPIDLFGSGTDGKPSLERFLRETPYTRLMWWPQHGFKRIQIWEATRMDPMPDFTPQPYEELGRAPQLAALAGSLFYTLIGNLENISAVPDKLGNWYKHLEGTLEDDPDVNACAGPSPDKSHNKKYTVKDVLDFLRERLQASMANRAAPMSGEQEHTRALLGALEDKVEGAVQDIVATIITKLVEMLLDGALNTRLAQILADWLNKELPNLIGDVLGIFVTDGVQQFWDTWMCGLPMDNQMDDQLWPTWFTELWIPVEKTAEVMQALERFYDGGGDPETAYQHTGAFSCELYAAKQSPFWMSPAYEKDMFRVDVFWFALNAEKPDAFYQQFWELLKPFGFRPHWGKIVPAPESGPWVDYYAEHFPRFRDFLALRDKLDPQQIFVNAYWRATFGIPPRTRG
jgi:hypothetical protein